jgi:radical SAM superfamily enzyme YgiQ (UPF0313 family)
MPLRILLIFPPFSFSKKKNFALPPLGILYLASFLKQKRPEFDVELLDLETTAWDAETTISNIINLKPDVVGFSVMSPYVRNTMSLVEGIKKNVPSIKIVLGGPHISATKDELFHLNYKFMPDYLVCGEGEEILLNILDSLHEKDLEIEGAIRTTSQGKIVGRPGRKFIHDLNSLPIIDFGLLDISNYSTVQAISGHSVSLMASRGCPFSCSFCDVFVTQGKKLRLRSPEHIISEIELNLRKYKIMDYYFKDSTFTLNRKWVIRLCENILASGLRITWSCNTRADLIDEELLAIMSKAGCKLIAFGFESADDEVLAKMNKKTSYEIYHGAIEQCQKHGIKVYGFFMIGNFGESIEKAQKTLDFALKENINWASFSPVTAYPGTELYQTAIREGVLKNPKWYLESPGESFVSLVIGAGGLELPGFPIHEQTNFLKMANRKFYLRLKWVVKMLPFFLNPVYLKKILPFIPKFLKFNFSATSNK